MSSWPFDIYSYSQMQSLGKFKDQDRLLSFVHAWTRKGYPLNDLVIFASGLFSTTGDDAKIRSYIKRMNQIEIGVRLRGSDVMGLDELVESRGWYIRYIDVGKTKDLDFFRYRAKIVKDEQEFAALGATKLEALSKAFIEAFPITIGYA